MYEHRKLHEFIFYLSECRKISCRAWRSGKKFRSVYEINIFLILFYSFYFNFKCFMCLIFTTIFPVPIFSFTVFVSVWYVAAKHHSHCGRRKIARSETEIWALSECELIYGISYFPLPFHVGEFYPRNLCLLLVQQNKEESS